LNHDEVLLGLNTGWCKIFSRLVSTVGGEIDAHQLVSMDRIMGRLEWIKDRPELRNKI
jgi:hypothetical protein